MVPPMIKAKLRNAAWLSRLSKNLPALTAPNSFPRGEAVAKIGSSEPILVTDEESGQKANWRYSYQTYSRVGLGTMVEVFDFPVMVIYPPHSSSVTAYAVPPSPREKVLGRQLPIS